MSLTSLFNKILNPTKKNEEKQNKPSSSKDIPKIRVEEKSDLSKSSTPDTPSKISSGRKESNLQKELEESRDELKVETRQRMRQYSPSIIVRELPKEEKDDMADLVDLLTPVPKSEEHKE